MLIALCFVAFVLGWYISSYYIEQKREETYRKLGEKVARNLAENRRKEEYLNYVWNSFH